jgi:hypothetical protein
MCILEKGQVLNDILTLCRCNVVTVLEVVLKWMFLILQSATKDRESRLCAMNKVRGYVTACCLYHGVFHIVVICHIHKVLCTCVCAGVVCDMILDF